MDNRQSTVRIDIKQSAHDEMNKKNTLKYVRTSEQGRWPAELAEIRKLGNRVQREGITERRWEKKKKCPSLADTDTREIILQKWILSMKCFQL